MPTLVLLNLECHDTEDDSGGDEAYLRINGGKVWGPTNINDGQTKDLGGVGPFPFVENIRIDLYDEDLGHWPDPDDHLGTQYVWKGQSGQGEQHLPFSGSRWNYTLHCRVDA